MSGSKSNMAIQLSQAIKAQEPFAFDIAASMGKQAIEELALLAKDPNPSVRMDALRALGKLELHNSYDIVFDALDDKNINVVQASLSIIEDNKSTLSIQILSALLEKVKPVDAKNRVILMLGEALAQTRLASDAPLPEMQMLEKYCTVEYGESLALHCVAALAKAGSEQRRQQFSAYMLSVNNNPHLLMSIFTFVEYIQQSWLIPSLRQLLNNKAVLHAVNAKLPNTPRSIRVCDKALLCIASIIPNAFSFNTRRFANFTDSQLAEANKLALN